MNNYCIHIRKKKNKPFCKILNKEITFCCCQQCDKKEYKTRNTKNSFYKIKKKSKKLARLEKDRFSVFTNNKNKCMFCSATTNLTWHEIFRGRNRSNSMKYGFCLRMCLSCHENNQEDSQFNNFWHKKAQLYFEEFLGSREEFIKIFKRNYLD